MKFKLAVNHETNLHRFNWQNLKPQLWAKLSSATEFLLKFDVECDLNENISLKHSQVFGVFFWRKMFFFLKTWFCSKSIKWQSCCRMQNKWYYFKNIHLNWTFAKNWKTYKFLKVEKFDDELFPKKAFSFFWKAFLTKLVGEKNLGGSRLYCYFPS